MDSEDAVQLQRIADKLWKRVHGGEPQADSAPDWFLDALRQAHEVGRRAAVAAIHEVQLSDLWNACLQSSRARALEAALRDARESIGCQHGNDGCVGCDEVLAVIDRALGRWRDLEYLPAGSQAPIDVVGADYSPDDSDT